VTDIVVTVRVDKSTITVINIVLELTFIYNMVDLFADTCDLTVASELTNNILVVLTLSKWKILVDWIL